MLCLIIVLEPKSPLYNFNQSIDNYSDLQQGDCVALYGTLVLAYNASASMKACRCDQTSFVNPSHTQCCKYFEMTLFHVNIEYDSFYNLLRASVIH